VIGWGAAQSPSTTTWPSAPRELAHKARRRRQLGRRGIHPTAASHRLRCGARGSTRNRASTVVVLCSRRGCRRAGPPQLVINAGATVIATAGPDNFDFLRSLGAITGSPRRRTDRPPSHAPHPDGASPPLHLTNYGDGNVDPPLCASASNPTGSTTIIDFRRRPAVTVCTPHGQAEGQRRPHLPP